METIQLNGNIEANVAFSHSPAGSQWSCFLGEDEHAADCDGQIGYGSTKDEAIEAMCDVLGIAPPQFVYVVQAGSDDYHEGGQVIGVFGKRGLADKAKRDYCSERCKCGHQYTAHVFTELVQK
jgi:hypothetical protein